MPCACVVNLTALTLVAPLLPLLLALIYDWLPGLCDRELSGILRFLQVISRRASATDCGLLLCFCTLWHSGHLIQLASDHSRFPGSDQVRTCVIGRATERMATPIGSPRVPSTAGSSLVTPVARDVVEPDDSAHAARCASHASLACSANASLLAPPAEDNQSARLPVPLLPCTAHATPGTLNASMPAVDARALPALPAFSASAAPAARPFAPSVPSWGPGGRPCPLWVGVLQTRAPDLLWSGAGQSWACAPSYDSRLLAPTAWSRCSA